MISFGVGKSLMTERRLFDGVIPDGVIVNPANVTVSLQNWICQHLFLFLSQHKV